MILSISDRRLSDGNPGDLLTRRAGRLQGKLDDCVKSPDAALRCILCHCGVRASTPHSSGFARLACGAFYAAVAAHLLTFCEFVKLAANEEGKLAFSTLLWHGDVSGGRLLPLARV
jgi:hypothetical protein